MKKYVRGTPSNWFGWAFIAIGLVPGLLWILDYVDVIRPGQRPTEWPIILMSIAMVGIGTMLVGGEGESIGEAFLSWFGKRGGDGS